MTELHPCAMLAKGPPCTNAAVPSVVCTRFGLIASCRSTSTEPVMPRSFTVNGMSSNVNPSIMLSILLLISSRSEERQRIAIISDAGVMSNPDSWGSPLVLGPSPVTICLNDLSLTSSTLFHNISLRAKPSFWWRYM